MSNREPELLIGDILESANKIIDYIGDLSLKNFVQTARLLTRLLGTLK